MQDRQFSTGSIEAPDPFDKHLDQMGYYRKHTARDATCLFRVISEQLYDAQIYHPEIREICVKYMTKYSHQDIITTDLTYDEYLAKMSKPRTFGTLAELVALAYRFKRNVVLFEECSFGSMYVHEKEFKETFLVFFTPPRHFDSVFPKSYIESVAFCQSLTYEILYSHVFKLPDVIYAVERMLHDPEEGTHIREIEVSPYDECQETLTLSDGRYFILDHADETECILKNYLFCHFHNKQFEKMIAQQDYSAQDDPDSWVVSDALASSLPRRNVSCVRQLLDENIKPFSYKVAKALDTHIYRNIEFDVWNDLRKNARFKQWSQGDTLQVGVKCIVDNIDENKKPYYCHIQEMRPHKNSCVVFVETMGENRVVPLSAIKTIPSVSWMVPNYQSRGRSEKKKKRNWHLNELSSNKCSKINDDFHEKWSQGELLQDGRKLISYFTKTLHIPQQYSEYITHPQYSSTNRFSKNDEPSGGTNQPNSKTVPAKKANQGGEKIMKADNAKNAPAKRSGTTAETKSGKPESLNVEFEPRVHYGNQAMCYMESSNPVSFQHVHGDMESSNMVQGYAAHHHSLSLQSSVKNKNLLRSVYLPNLNAQPSYCTDGLDLQRIDYPTLRFFYNLGHEYMRHLNYRFPPKAVTAMFNSILNDSFAHPNRYSGGYLDPYDIDAMNNDFGRTLTFSGTSRDQQHVNKANDGQSQYRRSYNSNTVNGAKKNTKNYRNDFNKGKRQFGDSEVPPKHQQQNYNKGTTDYSDAQPAATEPNVRTAECESLNPLVQQHNMYTYHEGVDPNNVYGVPVGYGMYPHVNDNFATYPVPVPGGVMFSEPLNVDNEISQTYPYYTPHGTYYYSAPMQPSFQMGQPQGSWYPSPMMPIQSTMPVPMQPSGTTVAPPTSTPTYGNYIVSDTETSAPFNQNEP